MIKGHTGLGRHIGLPARTRLLPDACSHLLLTITLVVILLVASTPSVTAHDSSTSFESTMQSARPHPHQQMCSLLFQTPACTQPALWRKPVVPRPSSCSLDTCSLSGPSAQAAPSLAVAAQGSRRRRVATAAQLASSTTSTSTQQWWKKQSELWVDVHTEEQFYHEVNTGDRLVFVGGYPALQYVGVQPPAILYQPVLVLTVACCPWSIFCADSPSVSMQTSLPPGAMAASARTPSCAKLRWTQTCRRRSSLSK